PPVATLTIDVVAGDDVLNLAESKVNQTISGKVTGEFTVNDIVSFTLNGTTYSAAVNAAGEWNVSVPGADLAEESNIHATLVAHDVAGNSANIVADHGYDVKIVPPQNVTLTINSVTLDNVINLSESLQNQTITGTSTGARAGDIVSLVIAGTTYSGTVNSTGKWSIAGVPGRQLVADTDHVIDGKIIASDTYGNTTEATTTHAYEVHTSPPDLYLYIDKITGDDIINAAEAATNQQITGTSVGTNPGDVIKITLNGVVYTSTLDAVGSWSVTVPGSGLVADVNHRLAAEIRTTDQWGNTATVTASHNYVVSITLVKPTIDQILDDVGIITGPITKGGVTDDSKPILSGTSDANATVAIYDNGSKIGSAIANGSGKWSFTPTTSLSEGKHDFTVDATSTFGTTSAKSEVFSITTDYTPPVANLSIDVIASNDVINYAKSQAQQTVSGKVTGEFTNGDVVSFTLNGHAYSATVNASGKWSVLVAGADLANADNIQATLVAHDAAGNSANATASHGYSVDLVSTTPQITSVYDAVGTKQGNLISGETTDEARPKFSGTAEANSVVTLYDKGTAIGSIVADGGGNWSYTPATDLADGAHNITVKAVDVAGNTSAASDAFSFTIDLTPAAPVIVSVYDDVGAKQGNLIPGETTDDARPTISGTSEPNRIVVIYDNTVWLGTTNSDANGDWSFTPRFDLANGTHSILARATDGTDRLSGVSNEFGFTISATTVSVSAQRLPAQDDSVSLHATSDHEQAHNAGPETVAVQQGVHSSSAQPQETESQGTPLPGIESPHAEPIAASAEEPAVAPHVDPLGHVVPAVDIAGISDTYYGESDSYVSLSSAEAYLASDANQGIHGSAGVDTLAVAGHDQVLDLSAAHGKVTGME
ncbi:Ig-like domain-containing protein, partial [Pseudomonas sp. GD03903]|uniref:Ig-like domain-containing protein n=1 Tax=Pseudomonas sp. GD03903 TaxID=2975402 RepID=UPI00244CB2DC